MIIDTSAIIAILRNETEAPACAEAIKRANVRRMSAVSYVETAIVMDSNRDPIISRRFDDLIYETKIVIESVTPAQAKIARDAYKDFGKGSKHRAGLNFGDCFAYALAKTTGEPLLFKGKDFLYTDIKSVTKL